MSKPSAKLGDNSPGPIQITQTRVVAEIVQTFDGNEDFLEALARVAMKDARDWMRTDQHSESEYGATVDGEVYSVTIHHTPAAVAHPPMTVAEAKRALTEARRREAMESDATPVTEEDYR